MSVSSGLHCGDKLLPETPKEELYHVGVSIPVPRGSLSNSHASHVPHLSPSAAFTWFPDVLLPPAAICKAASRVQLSHCCQDNANTATSYPSTPKHNLQPQQHLSTFSPPATRLNWGQTHIALTVQSRSVSGLQSEPAFLPCTSPFGKFRLSELSLPCPLGNHTHSTWRDFP